MAEELNNSLPHGAKGIDLYDFVVMFAKDKLVLQSKLEQRHITLHLGPNSQTLDIHEKYIDTNGSIKYNTLFTITHENLALMLQEIAEPATHALSGVLKRLRLGWMVRKRVGAVVGFIPVESEIQYITKRRHQKLVVDEEKLSANIWVPENLNDLYNLPDGHAFTVYDCRVSDKEKIIGFGYKYTDLTGKCRLVWCPFKRLRNAFKAASSLLKNAAVKYGNFNKPLPWL